MDSASSKNNQKLRGRPGGEAGFDMASTFSFHRGTAMVTLQRLILVSACLAAFLLLWTAPGGAQDKKEADKETVKKATEKLYTLDMQNRKWSDVFDYLADQTGLPFSGPYNVPGTVT